jgi:hypothetical protein
MSAGRPLKYKSVKEMQKDIDAYFTYCDVDKRPYTVSGLAYALDTNRQTLLNYEENEEFFDTIKKAKAKIECYNEEMLYNKEVPTTGVIFNLKNNYGWKDKQEVSASVSYEDSLKKVVDEDEY